MLYVKCIISHFPNTFDRFDARYFKHGYIDYQSMAVVYLIIVARRKEKPIDNELQKDVKKLKKKTY